MTTFLDTLNNTFLSVEFKDDTVSFACFRNEVSGIRFIAFSDFPHNDEDETITNIKNFITQHAAEVRNVFVSIPYEWSVIKFSEVPSPRGGGKNALLNMMKFEIERHIPFKVDDVFYDFQVMGKIEEKIKVIFVAVHKERINRVKSFLEKLFLNPVMITLSPFASLNSLELSGISLGGWQGFLGITKRPKILGTKNELSVMLFLDENHAFFALYEGNTCIHIKSFALISDKILDTLIKDISTELSSLHIDGQKKTIKKCILAGSVPFLKDFSSRVHEKLGVPVQTVDIFEEYGPEVISLEKYDLASLIGVCYMGLAYGSLNINLLPHKTDFSTTRTAPIVAKISLVVIMFLVIGIFTGSLLNGRKQLEKVNEEFKKNEPKIRILEKLTQDANSFKEKRDFLIARKNEDIILDVLLELTNLIPSDAWLTNFDFKKVNDEDEGNRIGELIISGQALSSSVLISVLEDSPLLEQVEFVGPITTRGSKEGFKIKASVIRQKASPVISKISDKRRLNRKEQNRNPGESASENK